MLQLSFVNFKRGSYILIEGKSDTDRFYIIQSGQVQIAKQKEVVAEEEGNLLGNRYFPSFHYRRILPAYVEV